MVGKKIIETDPITSAEVKEMLVERAESHELNYEQNLALDHVIKFVKTDAKTANKLVKEMEEIIKKSQAVKLADTMPKDLADMRLLLQRKEDRTRKKKWKHYLK